MAVCRRLRRPRMIMGMARRPSRRIVRMVAAVSWDRHQCQRHKVCITRNPFHQVTMDRMGPFPTRMMRPTIIITSNSRSTRRIHPRLPVVIIIPTR